MGPGKTPTEDILTLNNYFKILEAQLKEKYIGSVYYNEYALGLISVFHPLLFHPVSST